MLLIIMDAELGLMSSNRPKQLTRCAACSPILESPSSPIPICRVPFHLISPGPERGNANGPGDGIRIFFFIRLVLMEF